MAGIGDLPGGTFSSSASAVNADGSVVVGGGRSINGLEAFRWTDAGGMIGLGALPAHIPRSVANGVSADGSVVVGWSVVFAGKEAFRWTDAGGMEALGDLDGGTFDSTANAVSADGLVIVGSGVSTSGQEAFRWTEAGGMVGMGDLDGGSFISEATDVNADGSVIVGQANTAVGREAFRWKDGTGEGSGMQTVASLLAGEGVDVTGWDLEMAVGVSDDGKVIAGYGINPSGDTEGWRAVVDVGFVSVEDFFGSLEPAAQSAHSAQALASQNLDLVMNVARRFNHRQQFGQSQGGTRHTAIPWSSLRFASNDLSGLSLADEGDKSAWMIGGMGSYKGDSSEADDLIGSFGISVQMSQNLRAGTGFHIGGSEVLVAGVEGNDSDRETFGIDGYLAWEPSGSPLRLYAGVITTKLEDDIVRRYLNGVDPVTSKGRRDGRAVGGSLVAGWSVPAGERGMIMPFAEYEATRIMLDGYTETGGPFPAVFDSLAHTTQIARLGAELSMPVKQSMGIWGSLAWAHRFDEEMPGLSGHIPLLGSGFAFGGLNTNANWTEVKGGFSAQIRNNVSLKISGSAALDDEDEPRYGGTIGINVKL